MNQRSRDAAGLLALIALCLAVAAAGGAARAMRAWRWARGRCNSR